MFNAQTTAMGFERDTCNQRMLQGQEKRLSGICKGDSIDEEFYCDFFSRSRFDQLPVGMTSILAGLGQSLLDQPPNIQNLDPKK